MDLGGLVVKGSIRGVRPVGYLVWVYVLGLVHWELACGDLTL